MKILCTVARVNGTKLPEEMELHEEKSTKVSFIGTIKKLIKSRIMSIRTIILLFNWLVSKYLHVRNNIFCIKLLFENL